MIRDEQLTGAEERKETTDVREEWEKAYPADETPESEEEEKPQTNPQWRILRAFVGVYLIGLAYQLIRNALQNGDLKWYFVLFALLFTVFGAGMIYLELKKYYAETREIKREQEEADRAAEAERQNSLAQARARGELHEGMSITERLQTINESDASQSDDDSQTDMPEDI